VAVAAVAVVILDMMGYDGKVSGTRSDGGGDGYGGWMGSGRREEHLNNRNDSNFGQNKQVSGALTSATLEVCLARGLGRRVWRARSSIHPSSERLYSLPCYGPFRARRRICKR
jgi:hypothetical protein